jgi:RimJ/RimL family protein N-acetyltransferase
MNVPDIHTARLQLRAFRESDIPELVPLIGSREVAATTLRIPYPYHEDHARQFLAAMQKPDADPHFAILVSATERLCGGIGLRVEAAHGRAELGYWLGRPYWGLGYATEAARSVVHYGFEQLQLHRIFASHFQGNIASGKILKKLRMRYEGCQRQHIRKWDRYLDSSLYGLLREEWLAGPPPR